MCSVKGEETSDVAVVVAAVLMRADTSPMNLCMIN